MIEFFFKGGIFMYPILICSIVGLAIFLERLWSLRRSRVVSTELIKEVGELVRGGRIDEAIARCETNRSAIARIFSVAFKNIGKQRDILIEHLERVGTRETSRLQRFLEVLGTIAGISTLLGLLGTISGMIKIFSVISTQSTVNPTALAAGISEALITTYAGLVVAIPVIVMHRYLQTKADAYAEEMEEHSVGLMELLTEKGVQH